MTSSHIKSNLRLGFTLVELLVSIAILGVLASLLLPAIQAARESTRRTLCQEHLRQLGLACLMFESQARRLPPGIEDHDGSFQDAWHNGFVYLLPFLEEQALHDRYDFATPWKSPKNQEVARHRIRFLLCPSNASGIYDTGGVDGEPADYAFCKGDQAFLCQQPEPRGMFDINSRTRLAKVLDGLSQTFMLGEAISDPDYLAIPPCACDTNRLGQVWTKADIDGDTFHGHEGGAGSVLAITCLNSGRDGIWGTTDDLTIRPNLFPNGTSVDVQLGPNCRDRRDQIRGFVGKHFQGLYFVFGDGSVRWVEETIEPQVYRRMGTMCDRQGNDW